MERMQMNTLTVRLSTIIDVNARLTDVAKLARDDKGVEGGPTLNFTCYEDMHRVLAPSRLAIVKALLGQGALSIREVARRIGRDVQAVHRDVTKLASAGVIDRTPKGVEFSYDGIHFEFDVILVAGSVRQIDCGSGPSAGVTARHARR